MNHPVIVWCAIVGALLCTFFIRAIHHRRHAKVRVHAKHHRHFLELGKEKEIFFVPGDPTDDDDWD